MTKELATRCEATEERALKTSVLFFVYTGDVSMLTPVFNPRSVVRTPGQDPRDEIVRVWFRERASKRSTRLASVPIGGWVLLLDGWPYAHGTYDDLPPRSNEDLAPPSPDFSRQERPSFGTAA